MSFYVKEYKRVSTKIADYDRKDLIESIKRARTTVRSAEKRVALKNIKLTQTTVAIKLEYWSLWQRWITDLARAKAASDNKVLTVPHMENISDAEIVAALSHFFPAPVMSEQNGSTFFRLNPDTISAHTLNTVVGEQPAGTLFAFHIIKDDSDRLELFTPITNGIRTNVYSPAVATNFYHGVIAMHYATVAVYLQLYQADAEPQDFRLFDGNVNCVLECIRRQYPCKSNAIEAYAIKNGFINNNRPATKADLDTFDAKFGVRIIVHSQAGVWYTSRPNSKRHVGQVVVFASANHASEYKAITDIKRQVIMTPPDLYAMCNQLHQPKQLSLRTVPIITNKAAPDPELTEQEKTDADDLLAMLNEHENIPAAVPVAAVPVEYEVTSFRAGDAIYKSWQPVGPDADNPEYYHCKTDLCYKFTKWVSENNIRPLQEPFYSIAKAANHHLTTQTFTGLQPGQQELHNYDMVKAFPSFKNSIYYDQYKLFLGFVQLYSTTDHSYISKPGMTRITNIVYKNDVVRALRWIQDDNWYTNIRLNFILDHELATFDVTDVMIAHAEDIEFPFMPFDRDIENKRFNNSFIGRMIAGGHDGIRTSYFACTGTEMQQLKYELEHKEGTIAVIPVNDNLLVCQSRNQDDSLWHIHSQIIDYQQVALMTEMCQVPITELVAVFTDGFFTTVPQAIECTGLPHGFAYKYERITGMSTATPATHVPIDRHELPPIDQHLSRLSRFNITGGPAGCGKTYVSFEKHPRVSSIALAPQHKLKAKHIRDNPDAVHDTYHAFFGIGVSWHRQRIFEQVDIDEITQCSDEHLQRILATCRKHRMCLSLFGDMVVTGNDVTIYQRPPVEDSGRPIQYSTCRDFTFAVEISTIRRQSADDATFLDGFRDLTHAQQLARVRTRFPTIARADVSTHVPAKFTGIAASHASCNEHSKRIFDQRILENPDLIVPGRANKKAKNIIKGDVYMVSHTLVFKDRTTSNRTAQPSRGLMYDLAYFSTADSVQGESIDGPIYIDLKGCHMQNFLYVAITRARDLDNVVLIEAK